MSTLNKQQIIDKIIDVSKNLGLFPSIEIDGRIRVDTDHATGLVIFFELNSPKDFSFYFLTRTMDVFYSGDRSDVHVILSLMFASFLKAFDKGMTVSFFDIGHPVLEDEIWGRYIIPVQSPVSSGINTWEELLSFCKKLLIDIWFWRREFWQFLGCPCDECQAERNKKIGYNFEISKKIQKAVDIFGKSSTRFNSNIRTFPEWQYHYDIDNEITIIKSTSLSIYLDNLESFKNYTENTVNGIQGTIFIEGEINSYLASKSVQEFNKIFSTLLAEKAPNEYPIFIHENMVIGMVKPYIIALGRLGGNEEFKLERERIRKRHNRESELLFPITSFEWVDPVCPDQFECLIKELLEKESEVISVRRPAPINQSDKGRDLKIEWKILDEAYVTESKPPISVISVVGQCKASKKTIGKSQVQDIRDTVDRNNGNGFFLAVSTQISAPLTEALENLKRNKGVWTNWWNREDIESRLSKNSELISKYPKVIKAKNQIKFIEKKE